MKGVSSSQSRGARGQQLGVCGFELEVVVHEFGVGGRELGVKRDEQGVGGGGRLEEVSLSTILILILMSFRKLMILKNLHVVPSPTADRLLFPCSTVNS